MIPIDITTSHLLLFDKTLQTLCLNRHDHVLPWRGSYNDITTVNYIHSDWWNDPIPSLCLVKKKKTCPEKLNRIKLVSVEYIPLPMLWIFFWRVASFIASDNLCTLPKFNIAPEKLPKPNRKGLSSFTTFSSGVNSLLNFRRGGVIFQDFAWIPTLLCFNPQNLPRHV